jgi:hypothetical protein
MPYMPCDLIQRRVGVGLLVWAMVLSAVDSQSMGLASSTLHTPDTATDATILPKFVWRASIFLILEPQELSKPASKPQPPGDSLSGLRLKAEG